MQMAPVWSTAVRAAWPVLMIARNSRSQADSELHPRDDEASARRRNSWIQARCRAGVGRFKESGLEAKIEVYEALIPAPIEQVLETRGSKPWRARLKEELFEDQSELYDEVWQQLS